MNMINCEHTKVSKKNIIKDYLGEKFEIRTPVCSTCNAELWDKDTQKAFSTWLTKLDRKKRDRFIIQFTLTENTLQCLDRLIGEFPGSDRAKVLRAMTMFFTERVAPRQEWSDLIEKIVDRGVYKKLITGKREVVKVHFTPFAMLDIESWAKLAEIKPREFAESAATRIFAFYIENDPVMHKFWEENIRPELSLILKAA
jgi:hypothetical protein